MASGGRMWAGESRRPRVRGVGDDLDWDDLDDQGAFVLTTSPKITSIK